MTEWDQMQIFSTERAHPIPIETDEAARVRVIHKVMLRRFLPANLLLFVLLVIQLGIFITGILQNPAANLSNPSALLLTLALALIGLSVFLTLSGYLVWYLRARKAAETGERLTDTEQRFRTLTVAVAALGLLAVLFAVLSRDTGQPMVCTSVGRGDSCIHRAGGRCERVHETAGCGAQTKPEHHPGGGCPAEPADGQRHSKGGHRGPVGRAAHC